MPIHFCRLDQNHDIARTLVALPDVLERDTGLTPELINKAEAVIDGTLLQLYKGLVQSD